MAGLVDVRQIAAMLASRVLELVAGSAADTPRDDAVRAIRDRLVAEHPDYAYPVFLFGLGAVWDTEHAR